MTLTKKDLIYLSIILILGVVLFYTNAKDNSKLKKNEQELLKSQGREEVLRSKLDSTSIQYQMILSQRDSLIDESFKLPEGRTKTKIIYREKKSDIISLSPDSAVRYLSTRLSEADTLGHH